MDASSIMPTWDPPVELLSKVFVFVCEKYSDKEVRLPPQLILTHVCARWRSAAHNDEALWSTLYVHLPYRSTPRSFRAIVELNSPIKTWISRSGIRQLTIQFSDYWSQGRDIDSRLIFGMLKPYLQRCSSLTLACSTATLPVALLDLPLLKTLSLNLWSPSGMRYHQFPSSLSKIPQLQHLRIDGEMLGVYAQSLLQPNILPASQLLTLCITGSTLDPISYLSTIASCIHLEECSISIPHEPQPLPTSLRSSDMDPELFSHPALTSLSFTLDSESGINVASFILRSLRAPCLTTLYVQVDAYEYEVELPESRVETHMLGLFDALRSNRSLRSLELQGLHTVPMDGFRALLQVLPSLDFIGVYDSVSEAAFIEVATALMDWKNGDSAGTFGHRSFVLESCAHADSAILDELEPMPFTGPDDFTYN